MNHRRVRIHFHLEPKEWVELQGSFVLQLVPLQAIHLVVYIRDPRKLIEPNNGLWTKYVVVESLVYVLYHY